MRISSPSGSVAKVGRNDPCPCGSGDKYKRCHGLLKSKESPLWRNSSKLLILGPLAILTILMIGSFVIRLRNEPQRVWSEEHQHWHDAKTEEPVQRPPTTTLPLNRVDKNRVGQPTAPAAP